MEKNDIEEIFSHILIDEMTLSPTILIVWRNKEEKYFEFRMKVSREFIQDLNGILKDSPFDIIIDYPENNKEVTLDYLLNLCNLTDTQYGNIWSKELNKKLIPYIRNEKLNKLI
jgi:aminopeptidase C